MRRIGKDPRVRRWTHDLEQLARELPLRHAELSALVPPEEFSARIAAVAALVPTQDDMSIVVRIAALVASLGDAHTFVRMPVRMLCPLEFYWFDDGIHVTDTAEEEEALRFRRIVAIDGCGIDEVVVAVRTVISHENESFLKGMLPRHLPAVEILHALGVARATDGMTLTYEERAGRLDTRFVPSLPLREALERLRLGRLDRPEATLPLYRRHPDLAYWDVYLPESRTLYVHYAACQEQEGESVAVFGQRVLSLLASGICDRLVLDLRRNTGGDSSLLDPFLDALGQCASIDRTGAGGVFGIIGRDTFSSALLNAFRLKTCTRAILVGEPTGGKPDCFGEVQRFTLRHSGLVVTYSTRYYPVTGDAALPALYPDIPVGLTMLDYREGRDPCMDRILTTSSLA